MIVLQELDTGRILRERQWAYMQAQHGFIRVDPPVLSFQSMQEDGLVPCTHTVYVVEDNCLAMGRTLGGAVYNRPLVHTASG
jgi:hypothetical protein